VGIDNRVMLFPLILHLLKRARRDLIACASIDPVPYDISSLNKHLLRDIGLVSDTECTSLGTDLSAASMHKFSPQRTRKITEP
jgi:hypothetical protein